MKKKNVELPQPKRALFDARTIEWFRNRLSFARSRLTRLDKAAREAARTPPKDHVPDDYTFASLQFLQTMAIRLDSRKRILINRIDQALRRLEEGAYGRCERCDEPIGETRLQALPMAEFCIICQEAKEHDEKQKARHTPTTLAQVYNLTLGALLFMEAQDE